MKTLISIQAQQMYGIRVKVIEKLLLKILFMVKAAIHRYQACYFDGYLPQGREFLFLGFIKLE